MKPPGHRLKSRAHFLLMWAWILATPAIYLTGLANSVAFVTGISLYAIYLGHSDGWAAEAAADEAELG